MCLIFGNIVETPQLTDTTSNYIKITHRIHWLTMFDSTQHENFAFVNFIVAGQATSEICFDSPIESLFHVIVFLNIYREIF